MLCWISTILYVLMTVMMTGIVSGDFINQASCFTLGLRDSIMIAHSFEGIEFGPAQNLHGATYTVDVELSTSELVPRVNWVMDIGEASDLLTDALKKYNFKHLNDIFPDENTTTEFMCRAIHRDLVTRLRDLCGWRGLLKVKLHESHKAWAEYSAVVL